MLTWYLFSILFDLCFKDLLNSPNQNPHLQYRFLRITSFNTPPVTHIFNIVSTEYNTSATSKGCNYRSDRMGARGRIRQSESIIDGPRSALESRSARPRLFINGGSLLRLGVVRSRMESWWHVGHRSSWLWAVNLGLGTISFLLPRSPFFLNVFILVEYQKRPRKNKIKQKLRNIGLFYTCGHW